jgi:bacillopeptidase F
MSSSRLNNNLQKKAIHNIFIWIFGFIVIIALLLIFGNKILVEFSLLTEKVNPNDNASSAQSQQQNASYIAPPTLNPITIATNSAQITISGLAQKNQNVNLYLNNQMIDTTTSDSNGKFSFSSVTLQKGQNTITARAANNDNKESIDSNELNVSYSKSAPSLTITQPQDGQTFTKNTSPTLSIEGKTDQSDQVTVNGAWAIVDDQGNYNYLYTLQNGDNDIKVVATDAEGNQTTKEIHIHVQ